MSEADSRLLSEIYSIAKDNNTRLTNVESRVGNIEKEITQIKQMVEDNFVELKEM